MKIALLQTGKTTENNIAKAVDKYSGRIRKYTPFEIITIKDIKHTRSMPVQEQKIMEGEKIINSFNNDDYVVILDEKGSEFRTVEFAEWLIKVFMLPRKRIVFVTGGPWGFSDDVYKRADIKMSLSRMTFSHQMVRLLFLEQLYRALTIINGDPYHHE
jgi:23S rRNA (pseudouridine1915-N3)-methyltransferase